MKPKRMWSLMIVLLLFLAVFLASASSIRNRYRDRIMETYKNQLLLTSRILARNMSLSLEEFRTDLLFLSGQAEKGAEDVLFREFLEAQNGLEDDLLWEDEQGEIGRAIRGLTLEDPVLLTQFEDGQSVWQYQDKNGKHYMAFKRPLRTGGMLVLAVDTEQYYQQLISDIQIGSNGYIMVKNSTGVIIMHPQEEQWGIHVVEGRRQMYPELDFESLEDMVEEQCQGREGISEYYSYWWGAPDIPRVKKISAYAPASIGDDFWVISSVVDYDDYYLPAENGFRDVTLLFTGALFVFALMAVLLIKLLLDRGRATEEIGALREMNERLEELHQEEERMAHQQRLQIMGTMTGGIAHEFNNFLTPIMGHAELLMMTLDEDSEEYDSAHEIYEASEKAKDVIRQISALSRKNVETVYKRIEVKKLLTRASRMVESICPANIRLETEVNVDDTYILGNSTQLSQVILNICVNAAHAIGKKGDGWIRLGVTGVDRESLQRSLEKDTIQLSRDWNQYVQIDIADNGCGMDSETLKQIFTPFFTTKKAGEGTGLGLALAEQIVLSHKGYIYVESEPGKGSVFHVCLPVLETDESFEVPRKEDGKGLRLVAVDDNKKVLNLLEKNFSKIGQQIMTCSTREELAGILSRENVDVLVVDESLEGGSGVEFCMSIQGRYPTMIKIIMTDAPDAAILDAKHKKIIDAYLIKPVLDTTILRVVMDCQAERQREGFGV
ncbi:MAG: ATP-binding protein [Clostridiales bacterium]|nr:ATP-binding protein [Clostridiales bacterium]